MKRYLVCMLMVFGALYALLRAEHGSAQETRAIGSWSYTEFRDEFTDVIGFHAMATGGPGTLVFSCKAPGPNSVYAGFILPDIYLGDGKRSVQYRIDKNPAVDEEWAYGSHTAFVPSKKLASFAKEIRSGNILRFQVRAYDHKSVAGVIDIAGAEKAITQIMSDCKAIPEAGSVP